MIKEEKGMLKKILCGISRKKIHGAMPHFHAAPFAQFMVAGES
jgi:hypothetical protein